MFELNAYALSGILVAVTFFPLFIFTWVQGKTAIARVFSYHLLCVASWGIITLLVGVNGATLEVYHLWNVSFAIALFIPVLLLHSVLLMAGKHSTKAVLLIVYAQAAVFAVLTLSGKVFPDIQYMFNSMYYNQGSRLYLTAVIIWLGIVSLAHILLLQHYITSYPERKKQTLMLMLAIPFGFGGGLMNFLPAFGFSIYPIGNFLIPVYSIIVTYAILQYRFLEITYVLRKGLIYSILIGIVSLMYWLTIIVLDPILQKMAGYATPIPGFVAALILGFVYVPLRMKVEYLVDTTVFRVSREDITRQNEMLRQELMRAEKFKMVSNIAQSIVYEIRNPLTTIKGLSKLILERPSDQKLVEKSSATIDRQVERIDNLLYRLLKFATPSTPEFKQASIYNIIDDVLNILTREFAERKIQLGKQFHTPESELLHIDPAQFRQAIYNILFNAAEAMPEGGMLTIATDYKPFSEVLQKNFNPAVKNFFELRISDTGHGIPKKNLPFIFDPFFSPGERRVGLGLSIAHKIIKEHGGNIFVESNDDKGATFVIELPLTS